MEPKDHPIENKNPFPSTSIIGFQPLIFQGVTCITWVFPLPVTVPNEDL